MKIRLLFLALFLISLLSTSCLEKKHPWVGKLSNFPYEEGYVSWGGTPDIYGFDYLVETYKTNENDNCISKAVFVDNKDTGLILAVMDLPCGDNGNFYTVDNIIDHKAETRTQYLLYAKEKINRDFPGDEHLFEIDVIKMYGWDFEKQKIVELDFTSDMEVDYYMP